MKIAILGTRGVPPAYGGFETFAAELGTRLVARGHEVTVFCRDRGGMSSDWNGIRRIVLPAINHKYLETVSHTLLSALDALRRGFDVVVLCNAANAFVLPLLRATQIPVAINVDGIERRRRKWNILGRVVYAIGESLSVLFATRIIADAEVIARYYRERYKAAPIVIAYGADFPDEADSDVLKRLGLTPDNYILYVSRFEPENNPMEVVLAYEKLSNAPPLVMVGAGRYSKALVRELHGHAGDRVFFPGAIYGNDYRSLQRNATIYIQATEVGGTHPAMIEAMASGGCVLANDTPENREAGGETVRYFHFRPSETLSSAIDEYLHDAAKRETMRGAARQRAAQRYRWDEIASAYEKLLSELVR